MLVVFRVIFLILFWGLIFGIVGLNICSSFLEQTIITVILFLLSYSLVRITRKKQKYFEEEMFISSAIFLGCLFWVTLAVKVLTMVDYTKQFTDLITNYQIVTKQMLNLISGALVASIGYTLGKLIDVGEEPPEWRF